MSRFSLAALTVLGVTLIAMVGFEINGAGESDATGDAVRPARHAASPARPAAAPAEDQAGRWAATVLARPLFSPSRRPSTEAVAAGDQPLKLQGTILVPPARLAIFAPPGGGKSVVVHERDRMGALAIDEIRPGEVAATGPTGQVVFRLSHGGPAQPQASQPQAPGDRDRHAQ